MKVKKWGVGARKSAPIAGIAVIARDREAKQKPYRGSTRINADQEICDRKDKTCNHKGYEGTQREGGIPSHSNFALIHVNLRVRNHLRSGDSISRIKRPD